MKKIFEKIKSCWLLLAGIILLTAFIATAFQTDDAVSLPKEVCGEWVTTSPRYSDRFFRLENRLITFATGRDEFEVFVVSDIKKNKSNKGDFYTLTYSDTHGAEYKFRFHYMPDEGEGGAIRIKNQNKMVWMKRKASS